MTETWITADLAEAALLHAYDSVVITDADLAHGGPHVLMCNPAFLNMTGYELPELVGRNLRILQGPDTDRGVIAQLLDCLQRGWFFEGSTINYRKDGTPYHVQWNVSAIRDDSGAITNFISIQRDISARLAAEAERDMLADALNASSDPIVITDGDRRIIHANRSFSDVSGYSADDVVSLPLSVLYDGTPSQGVYEDMGEALDRGECVRAGMSLRTAQGSMLHMVHTATPFPDPRGQGYVRINTFTEITDLEPRAEHHPALATTDALTGLSNRAAAETELRMRLRTSSRDGEPLSVVIADIDHLDRINDTSGRAAGDEVLGRVAAVLRANVRDGDATSRWGSEEFLALLPGADIDFAAQIAEELRQRVSLVTRYTGAHVTMSLGVAQARLSDTAETLLQRADAALNAAKRSGRDRVALEVGL